MKSYWTSLTSVIGESTSNKPTNVDYLDSYESSWLVYACVRAIAENVAKIPYNLYKLRGNKVAEVENHPVLDLLAKPNRGMTQFELFDITQTYIELTGNAYWLKVRGERSSKIQELQVLRPDWVEIFSSSEKLVAGYRYRVGATTIEYTPEDIIHFTEPNPKSAFYGLPSIKPSLDIIKNLVYSTRWNKNFFKNNARPDFWILNKSKLSKEEKEEIKRQMYDDYGGVKNAHKFGIWEGDAEIVDMTKTMRDMEFSKLNEAMVNQILGSFGIGKAILGMQGMNRAEAEAQLYSFLSQKIEPKATRLYDKLNEFLINEYGEDLYLEFEDPTPENRTDTLAEYHSGINNYWLTINEIRDREGLEPVVGGWDIYMPFNLMPVGSSGMGKIATLDEKKYYKSKEEKHQSRLRKKILTGRKMLKAKRKIKSELLDAILKYKDNAKTFKFSDEKKSDIWKEHSYLLDQDEKLFKAFTVRLLKGQENRFLEALTESYKKDVSDIIDWDNEVDLFFKLSLPIFTDILERRGIRSGNMVGILFQVNPKVLSYLESKAFRFADYVNTTTREALKVALKEGIQAGEGVGELSKRVAGIFSSREKWEATRIARTEIIEVHSNADLLAYEQSGVVSHKEWLAEPTACEICSPLNGNVVLLKENFSGGFDAPPAHPNSYDDKTEIYTSNGWEFIKDLKKGNNCLSLNPKNFDLEYVPVIKTYKHKPEKMISFKNRNFDMLITEDHNVFYQTDWKAKHNGSWEFVKAKSLVGKKCGRMYRSSEWVGSNNKKIKIGKLILPITLYAEFMGWYLSEGSYITSRKGRISISQSQSKNFEKWEKIRELLEKMKLRFYISKDKFEINNLDLWNYVAKFGKSNQKFVPKEIKDSNPEIIKIFLLSYCLGDGNIKKAKKFKDGNFRDSITYTTSSKKMADDLGELIIKIGKRPSYYLSKTKGKVVNFQNGKYVINNNIHIISECYSQFSYLDKINIKKVNYNKFAYCIDIKKYHTLLTRRNGKVVWSGNCRCAILPLVDEL